MLFVQSCLGADNEETGKANGQGRTFERTKPHVNVGTIGHIDHGKTTTTAAILKPSRLQGFGEPVKSYAEIAKGGTVRDETKTVTIAVAHVEYETETASLRPHRLPGTR